ncbi:MAG: hypothetical protein HY308_05410 [Gammaproteobacteria bacterium]|nr:hypothetical protein [Gammaproteobacteria bacterium]
MAQHAAGQAYDPTVYRDAERQYYQKHLCRMHPWPPSIQATEGGNIIYAEAR